MAIHGPINGTLSERQATVEDAPVWYDIEGVWRYGELDTSISMLSAAFPAIPCGTPTKITVEILRRSDYQDVGDFIADAAVMLAVNGLLIGANLAKSQSWGTTQVWEAYEFTANLPSAAELNAGEVSAELAVTRVSNTGTVATAFVEAMRVTVED